ncbi:MAG: glycosyltransferase family 87 protein [bacterium]
MDRNVERTAGLLLGVTGLFYYLQSSINIGYLYATRNDFAHLYVAGYLADRGGDFFDFPIIFKTYQYLQIPTGLNPFVYPPFFALMLIPLSRMSYDAAWLLFTGLSHAAYLASLALLVRILDRDRLRPWFWWGVLLALSGCFYPLFKTYSAGQMNTFMLLGLTGGWYWLSNKRDAAAGAWLGLGAAVKITPAFLLLYLAWKKRWTGLATGLAVLLLSGGLSLAWLGKDVHVSFLHMARDMRYGCSTWSHLEPYNAVSQHYDVDPFNQAPSALWYRLLTRNETVPDMYPGITDFPALAQGLSYLTALSIIGLLLGITRRDPRDAAVEEYALWILGMLLLPSLFWDHYLVQALFVIAVAVRSALEGKTRGIWGLAVGIALLAIPFHHDNPLFRHGWMTLGMSVKLYGVLLAGAYLILNRRKPGMTETAARPGL